MSEQHKLLCILPGHTVIKTCIIKSLTDSSLSLMQHRLQIICINSENFVILYKLFTVAQIGQNYEATSSIVMTWLKSCSFCSFHHNHGFTFVRQWDGSRLVARVVLKTKGKGALAFFWVQLLPRR